MPDEQDKNEQAIEYDPDELIGTAEAAGILEVTQRYINRLINREENPLPAKLVGTSWVIRRGDLELFRERPSRGRPKKED